MNIEKYAVKSGDGFKLSDYNTDDKDRFGTKSEGIEKLASNQEEMFELQDKYYANDKEGVLIIFQAMDAAGKDGTIKHVMKGLNPQGVQVYAFKQPTSEDLDHDFLWRYTKKIPERGNIGIFNRSYYEDVLVAKVHDLPKSQKLPKRAYEDLWESRYESIRNLEKYLYRNGIAVIKIFLNVSYEEQGKRFLKRIDDEKRNWKFSKADISERGHWNEYMKAFEDAIKNTATKESPWYIIPADKKWFARTLVSEIIIDYFKKVDPKYPELREDEKANLAECREVLVRELEQITIDKNE